MCGRSEESSDCDVMQYNDTDNFHKFIILICRHFVHSGVSCWVSSGAEAAVALKIIGCSSKLVPHMEVAQIKFFESRVDWNWVVQT